MRDLPEPSPAPQPRLKWRDSLSFRLFVITILSVLVVEALIFIPSATRQRYEWMKDQVEAGRLAALALEAAPSRMVSQELADDLLMSAGVHAVAELSADMREIILDSQVPLCCRPVLILMDERPRWRDVLPTLATFFAPEDRYLIIRAAGSKPGFVLEVAVKEAGLKAALSAYALNILWLSLIISAVTGALIYLMLWLSVVRPMLRVTGSVEQFRHDPGGWTKRLPRTTRRDEIGRAQNALADMEEGVSNSFRQQERLAQLGEAVAKINHDLRNTLATAQLVSDGLSRSEDPRVAKLLPRLERALERGISLASDTLKYGRPSAPLPQIQGVSLFDAVEEAAAEALAGMGGVVFENAVPPAQRVQADPDHLHRICANLIRNAGQAMEGAGSVRVTFEAGAILISDRGPGLPGKAKDNLFKAFAGSTRRDGTGLGLAISRDLARAMGGDLQLAETGPQGTRFRILLPEKP